MITSRNTPAISPGLSIFHISLSEFLNSRINLFFPPGEHRMMVSRKTNWDFEHWSSWLCTLTRLVVIERQMFVWQTMTYYIFGHNVAPQSQLLCDCIHNWFPCCHSQQRALEALICSAGPSMQHMPAGTPVQDSLFFSRCVCVVLSVWTLTLFNGDNSDCHKTCCELPDHNVRADFICSHLRQSYHDLNSFTQGSRKWPDGKRSLKLLPTLLHFSCRMVIKWQFGVRWSPAELGEPWTLLPSAREPHLGLPWKCATQQECCYQRAILILPLGILLPYVRYVLVQTLVICCALLAHSLSCVPGYRF